MKYLIIVVMMFGLLTGCGDSNNVSSEPSIDITLFWTGGAPYCTIDFYESENYNGMLLESIILCGTKTVSSSDSTFVTVTLPCKNNTDVIYMCYDLYEDYITEFTISPCDGDRYRVGVSNDGHKLYLVE